MGSSSQDHAPTAGAAQGTSSLAPRESGKPGPWRVVGYFIEGPDGETIARVERHGSEEHPHNPHWFTDAMTEQDAARARLISAAPELLEALITLSDGVARFIYPQPDKPHSAWAKLQAARAAIRKALSDGSEARTGGEEG